MPRHLDRVRSSCTAVSYDSLSWGGSSLRSTHDLDEEVFKGFTVRAAIRPSSSLCLVSSTRINIAVRMFIEGQELNCLTRCMPAVGKSKSPWEMSNLHNQYFSSKDSCRKYFFILTLLLVVVLS